MRPGELAGELQMTTSNVAAALRSLEEEGLVARRGDPEDRGWCWPTSPSSGALRRVAGQLCGETPARNL
jgi:DNA-binding MarR family transcriptional regulator